MNWLANVWSGGQTIDDHLTLHFVVRHVDQFQGSTVTHKLEGKVAIVTGVASGIGRAAALALEGQGARWRVADVDTDGGRGTTQAIVAAGGAAAFIRTDVSAAAE